MSGMKMAPAPSSGTVVDSAITRSLGVNIHTRPMGVYSPRPGAVAVEEHQTISEPSWNLTNWVERPQVVSSVQWTTALAARSPLMEFNIPIDLLVTNFLKAPFNSFKYWRGSVEFHLQTSGTPFHQGSIIMYYVPVFTKATPVTNAIRDNICAQTSLQHTILHANTSTAACLTIPFISPNSYIDSANTDPLSGSIGSLFVSVLNPLIAASGASTKINVSLIVQFKDSQFKIPRYQAEGLIEKLLGTSGGKLIQRMLPENIVADTIDAALGLVGLDRPTSIERMPPMKMIGTNYMNSTADIDFIDKFSMFPSKLQMLDSTIFGVSDSEVNFDHLKQRYTYCGNFVQNIDDAPGNVLAVLPLCPVVVPLIETINTTAPFVPAFNYIPLLEYISLPYKFWKGGLTFKIQVVATSFHNTKIFAAIQYGNFTSFADRTVSAATNQYGYAFEVNQGSTEFEFTVPYVSFRPQLAIPGSYTTVEPPAAQYDDTNCMGALCIYVVNELAVSNNVSSSISYNVFIAGATDYAVNSLCTDNQGVVPVPIGGGPFPPTFVAESILTSPMSDTSFQKQDNVIAHQSNSIGEKSDVNERSIDSVLDPLFKYNLVYSASFNASNFELINYDVCNMFRPPVTSITGMAVATYPVFPNYIASMYAGFRGPLRFKIALQSCPIGASLRVMYTPPLVGPFNLPGYLAKITSSLYTPDGLSSATTVRPYLQMHVMNSTQKTAEIEIPFSTWGKFIWLDKAVQSAAISGDTTFSTLGYLMLIFDKEPTVASTVRVSFDIYAAIGDESRMGAFSGVPPVYIPLASTTGLSTIPNQWGKTYPPIYTLTYNPR